MKTNGIYIIENWIDEETELELLELVKNYEGGDRKGTTTPSRMIRFGDFRKDQELIYDSKLKEQGYKGTARRSYGEMNDGIDRADKNVPEVLLKLGERLFKDKILDAIPPVYIINKYPVGVGIGKHIDHSSNGPVIPVIGLLSEAVMRLHDPTTGETKDFVFPRRALCVLEGDARDRLFHSILPVKNERYSLVFRNLPKKEE